MSSQHSASIFQDRTYQAPITNAFDISGAFQGEYLGGPRGPVPSSKTFYLYVTATINSMKISFNDGY